jgi:hypothetical protein
VSIAFDRRGSKKDGLNNVSASCSSSSFITIGMRYSIGW